MKASLLAAAVIAAVGLVGLPSVVSATTPPAAPTGSVVVRNAMQPTLTAIGRTGLLLTAARPDRTLVERTARVVQGAPAWGKTVTLGKIDRRYVAQVALNRRGAGAVAWGTKWGTADGNSTLVRLRGAKGTWSKPYRIPASATDVYGVAVNRRGTVAVITQGDNVPAVLAVHRPGRTWHAQPLKGFLEGANSVAVAPDDSIYVAGALVERGGDGTAVLGRLSPKGTWTQGKLAGETRNVESAQVLVTPDGKVHLVVGRIGSWASTYDTEYYWATRYVVLTRDGTSGPWTTTWDHDGASNLSARTVGGALQLTWTQYADPVADPDLGQVPQRLELRTVRTDAPASGADGTLLASQPTDANGFGGLNIASTTAAAGSCLVVAWRTDAATHNPSPLSSSFNGATRTWPDTGKSARYDAEAAAACVAGHGYLARTVDQTTRAGHTNGGSVRVEPLLPLR